MFIWKYIKVFFQFLYMKYEENCAAVYVIKITILIPIGYHTSVTICETEFRRFSTRVPIILSVNECVEIKNENREWCWIFFLLFFTRTVIYRYGSAFLITLELRLKIKVDHSVILPGSAAATVSAAAGQDIAFLIHLHRHGECYRWAPPKIKVSLPLVLPGFSVADWHCWKY